MSELRFEAAGTGALLRADLRIEPGLCVVFSHNSVALGSLVTLAGGVEPPARGRVVFDGMAPATSPAARRRIATLLASESLPPGGDVRSAVSRVLRARGDGTSADGVLGALGFLARSRTPVHELSAAERRSLALGLALSHERASLFALFEPLAANHGLEPDAIRERLAERVRAGAIVLVATASADVAAAFGGAHLEIEAGVLRSALPVVAPPGVPCALYVETREPQRLIGAAGADPAVLGVSWHEPAWPHLVTFAGSDLDALSAAVTHAAAASSIEIERMSHSASLPSPAGTGTQTAPYAQAAAYAPAAAYALPTGSTTTPHSVLDPQAARPPDQSIGMPSAFADPTRPREGQERS